jgi:hypothetical protein
MQISASNLLLAAQQVRNSTAAPPRADAANVAKATISTGDAAQFEALAFKNTAPEKNTPLAKPENPFAPAKRMGSQLDIKV